LQRGEKKRGKNVRHPNWVGSPLETAKRDLTRSKGCAKIKGQKGGQAFGPKKKKQMKKDVKDGVVRQRRQRKWDGKKKTYFTKQKTSNFEKNLGCLQRLNQVKNGDLFEEIGGGGDGSWRGGGGAKGKGQSNAKLGVLQKREENVRGGGGKGGGGKMWADHSTLWLGRQHVEKERGVKWPEGGGEWDKRGD